MSTRRNFLKTTFNSAVALSLSRPGIASAAEAEWRNRRDQMRYRRLGRTRLMVSEIVMGGNEIAPDDYEHILPALDRGLNYLDTAPAYGRGKSEQALAKVIKARPRDQFILNSKVSLWDINRNRVYQEIYSSLSDAEQADLRRKASEEIEARGAANPQYFVDYFTRQRDELDAAALCNVMEKEYGRRVDRQKNYKQLILESVDESLSRLGTDHLDIVMCPHGASSPAELLNYPEIFEAFETLKKAGKVRHLGVSAHTDPAGVVQAAVESGVYSVAMVAYNIVNHTFVDDALSHAHSSDLGVIAMKVARPVFPGPGRGPADPSRVRLLEREIQGDWSVPQRAYLWALRNKNLSAVVSNMVNADQVRENLILPTASA
ncbi:MAG: aldo/keto reductase [Planctomycetota bacterium]|jgi:aryl-alcohol dehydrogenase-like predicted oxidoreductase